MPLVGFALAAYIAGLYAGFSGARLLEAAAILAAIAVGARRGAATAIAFVALTAGGIGIARSAAHQEEQCADHALHSHALTVVVADSASPGGFTRGRLGECEVSVALSVTSGDAPAG